MRGRGTILEGLGELVVLVVPVVLDRRARGRLSDLQLRRSDEHPGTDRLHRAVLAEALRRPRVRESLIIGLRRPNFRALLLVGLRLVHCIRGARLRVPNFQALFLVGLY